MELLLAILVPGIVLLMVIALAAPGHTLGRRSRAEQRAEALVRHVLTLAESDQLERDGFLKVASTVWPGCTYHVPPDGKPGASGAQASAGG